MKNCADYIADAKRALGDARMSDRELGEKLGGYIQSSVARAKGGYLTDPLAVRLAEVIGIDPGELLLVARAERERDPTIAAHLRAYAVKRSPSWPREPRLAVPGGIGGSGHIRPDS